MIPIKLFKIHDAQITKNKDHNKLLLIDVFSKNFRKYGMKVIADLHAIQGLQNENISGTGMGRF